MLFKVSPLIFLSLLFFTFPLNVPSHSPTGRPTQDSIHDATGFWTTTVESSYVSDTADQTSNSKDSCDANQTLNSKDSCNANQTLNSKDCNANQTNKVFVSSQTASTKKKCDGDFYSNSATGTGVKWDNVDALLKFQVRGMLDSLNLKDVIRRTNASDVCKTGLERYLNSLYDLEPWSVKSEYICLSLL